MVKRYTRTTQNRVRLNPRESSSLSSGTSRDRARIRELRSGAQPADPYGKFGENSTRQQIVKKENMQKFPIFKNINNTTMSLITINCWYFLRPFVKWIQLPQ